MASLSTYFSEKLEGGAIDFRKYIDSTFVQSTVKNLGEEEEEEEESRRPTEEDIIANHAALRNMCIVFGELVQMCIALYQNYYSATRMRNRAKQDIEMAVEDGKARD